MSCSFITGRQGHNTLHALLSVHDLNKRRAVTNQSTDFEKSAMTGYDHGVHLLFTRWFVD